ncbi:restriction endonuclease subunit S [Cellulophaga sp. HaHa_2_1]|uniref:restriction endonuclease subunit S n=1 Tax=Cellulophaga sp. HaHa_2_1 TaxID=2749994 RepID=UPI001C4FEED4|nr:restriction endonuclease subunit S [Cellulophaga sp. HaHa_2_1]QXP52872.1 restriction endonuclease subunit S [Cellulophaga sp. HaHa_2_1]
MQGEKQLVPKLRFSEFEESWEKEIISNISDKITDGTHDTPKQSDRGIPFLTAVHVKDGNIDFENCYYLSEEEHNKIYSRCNPELGDLLMVNIGSGTATSAMVNVTYEFSLKNVALIKPNKSKVYPGFLAQIQRRNSARLKHQISSGGAQPFLSLKSIGKLKLIIPSIKEQQKIASFLTSIDTQIQTLEKKKILLEQYKKGVMQKIFKQELRFKDDGGNAYPDWEFKNGNLLFKSISDKNHNSDLPILAVTQDQGAIPRHLINYNIGVSEKSVDSYKVVQVGDFIISLRSFQGGIEYSNYKGICSPAYIILKPIDELDRAFYKYYLKTSNYIQELTKKLEGIRDGKMISYKYFSEIKLPYPSVKEQVKISNFLTEIDKNINLVNTKIEHTKAYKKGLLQQMFV